MHSMLISIYSEIYICNISMFPQKKSLFLSAKRFYCGGSV